MLKKNYLMILALVVMFAFVLAACNGGGGTSPVDPPEAEARVADPETPAANDNGDDNGNGNGNGNGGGGAIAGLDEEDEVEILEGDGDITLRLTWLSGGGLNRDGIRHGLQPFIEETGIGVDIIYVTGDWAEYFTKIQLMVAAGETIDLANVAIEGFEMLVQLGLAVPVDDWIVNNQAEWDAVASDISPAVMDVMNFRGEQFGLPKEWNNVVTHINTAMLEEAGLDIPPPNWDRAMFLEYAQAMTMVREDGTRQFGVHVPNAYFMFQGWLFNNGTTYMSEDFTESNLLDPRVIEMFQFMYDLIYVYEVAPIPQDGVSATHLLIQGDVGMHFAGRWPTNQYYEAGFTDVTIQYVPQMSPGYSDVVWGGTGVFTLRTSAHPDEATRLAVHLSSPQFIEEFMGAGAIPVLNSVAERLVPALGVPQNHELFITSAEQARPVQSPAQYAEVASLIHMAMSDILVSRRDVETVLQEADAQLNMILFDNR